MNSQLFVVRELKICLTSLLVFISVLSMAQATNGYYDNADGKSGEELKTALYNIIKGHTEYPYTSSSTDTWDILKEADRDLGNSANVIGIYSGFSMNGAAEYDGGDGWSREHVWAKSRGDFGTSRGAGTDCHHIRAEDVSTNSARSNRNFDECSTPYVDNSGTHSGSTQSFTSSTEFVWEPRAEVKGDVARMLFYMATRYEGDSGEPDLELTEQLQGLSSNAPLHARISVLLEWHEEDPVSEEEKRRNDIIYSYQNNRNPYIDHPEFVQCVWGSGCGDTSEPEVVTGTDEYDEYGYNVYPNPVSDILYIQPQNHDDEVHMYNMRGQSIFKSVGLQEVDVRSFPRGVYFLMIGPVNNRVVIE